MSQVCRRQVTEVVVQEERVKIGYLKGRKTYFDYCLGNVAGTPQWPCPLLYAECVGG